MPLTDFSVFYSQDSADAVAASIKEKGSKIVVERGQIVKICKDAKGIARDKRCQEPLIGIRNL